MSKEAESLQLQMTRPPRRSGTPPLVSVAGGYTLRTFHPEDMQNYLSLAHGAGFDRFTAEKVEGHRATVLPDGFFVVEHEASRELVASAMAQHVSDEMHPEGGVLGWVMGNPRHSGRGLGTAVCVAATARLLRAGYRRMHLKTDDERLPALKIYFKLGWVPLLYAPDMETRWQEVCAKLGREFSPHRWQELAGGTTAR